MEAKTEDLVVSGFQFHEICVVPLTKWQLFLVFSGTHYHHHGEFKARLLALAETTNQLGLSDMDSAVFARAVDREFQLD